MSYLQTILANGFLYTSGQIPLNTSTGTIEENEIKTQAVQAIKNLDKNLEDRRHRLFKGCKKRLLPEIETTALAE